MLQQHEQVISYIKSEVLVLLEENKKNLEDVTSYSVIQKSNKVFSLYVWWTGKVEKGVKTKIEVVLDTSIQVAKLAHDAMAQLREEASNISLLSKIEERNKLKEKAISKQKDKGW